MDQKAQAGLEYLMTYGWALVMIAAIFGVIVFIVGAPGQQVQFTSTQPADLLVKSSAVDATTAKVVLQNVTGGQMQITGIAETGFTSGSCTIDTKGPSVPGSLPFTINTGAAMLLECNYTGNPQGAVTIAYKNFSGLAKTAGITASGGTSGGTPISCGTGGYSSGGKCWYMGAVNTSCTTVCATHGLPSPADCSGWTDTSCTVCKAITGTSACNPALPSSIFPAFDPIALQCTPKSGALFSCSGTSSSFKRVCACNS